MLTLIYQARRLLVLGLVLQRQVRGESRFVMHNGMFHSLDSNVNCFLILLEPRSMPRGATPSFVVHTLTDCLAHTVNGRKITSRLWNLRSYVFGNPR